LLEVRRAQGFLDDEVILGKPAQQWHIVGNSVARQVALALGMAVREAWFGTLYDEPAAEPNDVRLMSEWHEPNNYFPNVTDPLGLVEGDIRCSNEPAIDHARDICSYVIEDPVSTPSSSVDDPHQERFNIWEKYDHKRQKDHSSLTEIPAKKLRLSVEGSS
jgi:hypothetical protein